MFLLFQVTEDTNRRIRVFKHHFLTHTGSKTFIENIPRELTLDNKIPWEEQSGTIFTFKANLVSENKLKLPFHICFCSLDLSCPIFEKDNFYRKFIYCLIK